MEEFIKVLYDISPLVSFPQNPNDFYNIMSRSQREAMERLKEEYETEMNEARRKCEEAGVEITECEVYRRRVKEIRSAAKKKQIQIEKNLRSHDELNEEDRKYKEEARRNSQKHSERMKKSEQKIQDESLKIKKSREEKRKNSKKSDQLAHHAKIYSDKVENLKKKIEEKKSKF